MKIKRLDIRRMPGFSQGMKELKPLAGNINVIAGPNGSGKSSVARVIQQLIWWNRKNTGYIVDAEVDVNGEQQEIQIDAQSYLRHTSHHVTSDDFSFVTPVEFSNQYLLALHNLVNENDQELAKVIAREIHGGIDLKKAAARLDYKGSIPNTNNSFYREYESAQHLYREQEQKQKGVKREELRLDELRKNREIAGQARQWKDLYEKYRSYMEARDEVRQTEEWLAQYPQAMERLRDDDLRNIDIQEGKIREIEYTIEAAGRKIAAGQEKLKEMRIPEEFREELIHELSSRIDELRDTALSLDRARQEVVGREVERKAAAERISSDEADLAALRSLQLTEVSEWSELIRKANEVAGKHQDLLNRIERVKRELETLRVKMEEKECLPTENVTEGLRILSYWLKEENGKQRSFSLFLWLLPLMVTVAAFLAYRFELVGLTAGVAMAVLSIPLVILLRSYDRKKRLEDRVFWEEKYGALELEAPEVWCSEQVVKCLRILEQLLSESVRWDEEKKQLDFQLGLLEEEESQSEKQWEKLLDDFSVRREKMGALPRELEQFVGDYNALYLLLNDIIRWQKAVVELEKWEGLNAQWQEQHRKLLERINGLLSQLNYDAVEDATQAAATLQCIRDERERRREIRQEIERQKTIIQLKTGECTTCREVCVEIYHRLGVAENNKDEINQLIAQQKGYLEARKRQTQTNSTQEATHKLLSEHPLYSEHRIVLESLTGEEIDRKIEAFDGQEKRLVEIIEEISRIEAEINNIKSGHDMEMALERKEEAMEGLTGFFEETLKSATGDILVAALQEEISLNNDNKVFRHANQILGSITRGKYSLTLGEGIDPEFRAKDNVLNRRLTLSEISTGTRVQLLLSIRLAYIETQENSIRLPVLADELLANSDDERSEAIIEALLEISRNRQLFYFTAQADEVQKWNYYLGKHPELSSSIIHLGDKQVEHEPYHPEITRVVLQREAPSPEGMNDQSYRELLDVKPFNPEQQQSTELHLWYLLEDPRTLYSCLQLGLYQWGQLHSFFENGGIIPNIDEALYQQMEAKIRILEQFQWLYNQGRPKKINREILIISGAVSPHFIDKAAALLGELDNDPQRLLDAMEAGEIERFSRNKKEELREWLLEHNYLPRVDPLTEEELHIRLNAIISTENVDRQAMEAFLNRILL